MPIVVAFSGEALPWPSPLGEDLGQAALGQEAGVAALVAALAKTDVSASSASTGFGRHAELTPAVKQLQQLRLVQPLEGSARSERKVSSVASSASEASHGRRTKLAKLVELARRYHILRLLSLPLSAWKDVAVSRRPKRHRERRQRMVLVLRSWHLRAHRHRCGYLLPLLRALAPPSI